MGDIIHFIWDIWHWYCTILCICHFGRCYEWKYWVILCFSWVYYISEYKTSGKYDDLSKVTSHE